MKAPRTVCAPPSCSKKSKVIATSPGSLGPGRRLRLGELGLALVEIEEDMLAQEIMNGGRGGGEFGAGNFVVAIGIEPSDALERGQIVREFELDLLRADGDAAIAGVRAVGACDKGAQQQQHRRPETRKPKSKVVKRLERAVFRLHLTRIFGQPSRAKENSPPTHRWVPTVAKGESRQGRQNSFVPDGTWPSPRSVPT